MARLSSRCELCEVKNIKKNPNFVFRPDAVGKRRNFSDQTTANEIDTTHPRAVCVFGGRGWGGMYSHRMLHVSLSFDTVVGLF